LGTLIKEEDMGTYIGRAVLAGLIFCGLGFATTSSADDKFRTCFLIRSDEAPPLTEFKKIVDRTIKDKKLNCSFTEEHPKHRQELSYSCDEANKDTFWAFGDAFEQVVQEYQTALLSANMVASAGDTPMVADQEFESVLRMTINACGATCVTHSCGTGISQCWQPGRVCRVKC
jgi:hypothetical protein